MRIGIIQASSQAGKNELIYNTVKKYAPAGSQVLNFGCTEDEWTRGTGLVVQKSWNICKVDH